jgi:hypothetical protein
MELPLNGEVQSQTVLSESLNRCGSEGLIGIGLKTEIFREGFRSGIFSSAGASPRIGTPLSGEKVRPGIVPSARFYALPGRRFIRWLVRNQAGR